MATKNEYFPPQPTLMARPVDLELDAKLTGKPALDAIAVALRAARFEFDPDDLVTIATADTLAVSGPDEYARGYELLAELGALEARIKSHYERFDKPLAFLSKVVRDERIPQTKEVTPVKTTLAGRLGTWKALRDQEDRDRQLRVQEVADAAARASQQAKADSLRKVAAQEVNPQLAASFQQEAAAVSAADVHAAPVELQSSVPVVDGYTRKTWKCEFVDLKELLLAFVEGRCFLDEEAIIEGLQTSLDKQAGNLTVNMSKAFPGTRAIPKHTGVARKL